MRVRRRVAVVIITSGVAVVAGTALFAVLAGTEPVEVLARATFDSPSISGKHHGEVRRDSRRPTGEMPPSKIPDVPSQPHADAMAALPEARYDGVIGGLDAETAASSGLPELAYSLRSSAAIYGADRVTPIGYLPPFDFLGEPTVIVPLAIDGGWARILTPARQRLPSASSGLAPAQTSAWIAFDTLTNARPLDRHIEVSVSAQTLAIMEGESVIAAYSVGVGTFETPTPTGVTGYLQARYLDPSQNQAVHRVQLTSLHATSVDEPYGGSDGGLIGLHFSDVATGAVTHGCIRLQADAIVAVDALPLGTLITIRE